MLFHLGCILMCGVISPNPDSSGAPLAKGIAESIQFVVSTYDDGSCQKKTFRAANPKICYQDGRHWKRTHTGLSYWHRLESRMRYYRGSTLIAYAKRQLAVAEDLGVCPTDGSFPESCRSFILVANAEFLRQSRFRPDAVSKYNKANNKMCQDKDFRGRWPGHCTLSLKDGEQVWVATDRYFVFHDPWCDKIRGRESLTPSFRRRCRASRIRRADLGMGQQNMGTLNRIGPQFCLNHPEYPGCSDGWHYTMVRDPYVSIWTTMFWIKGQTSRCSGKAPESCRVTKGCGGWPMKVGNPDSACHHIEMMQRAFEETTLPPENAGDARSPWFTRQS